MPIRQQLAKKQIHRDARRLRATGAGAQGGTAPHALLGVVHSDTDVAAPAQGALVVADSTPEWTVLLHPAAAGYALTTDATDTFWDQTPTWSGLHTFDADISIAEYIYHTGDADTWIRYQDDQITLRAGGANAINIVENAPSYIGMNFNVRMNTNQLVWDVDFDSYMYASADDVVDLVLAGASGEFGITINGAEDFTFTANAFNVPNGSRLLCAAGGLVDINGSTDGLILDADGDTTLSAPTDDQIDVEIAGADDFTFTANSFNVLSGSFLTMADDTGIGIGPAAGRITFDNQAVDQIEFQSCVVIVNDTTLDGNQSGNVAEIHDGYFGVQGEDGEPAVAQIYAYGSAATDDMAIVRLRRARNTQAAPSAVQSGDAMGRLGVGGYGTNTWPAESTMYLQALAAENFTNANMGTHMQFAITAVGSNAPAEAMRLAAAGRLKIGGSFGTIDAQAHILQDSPTGNIQVLALTQDDVDQSFIRYEGTAAAADLTRSIVDVGDVSTATVVGYVAVYVNDLGNQVTDGKYYMPVYSLS